MLYRMFPGHFRAWLDLTSFQDLPQFPHKEGFEDVQFFVADRIVAAKITDDGQGVGRMGACFRCGRIGIGKQSPVIAGHRSAHLMVLGAGG